MESMLREYFGNLGILIVPVFSGVLTSFVVEALNYLRGDKADKATGKSFFLSPKFTNLVISIIVTVLTGATLKSYIPTIWDALLYLVANISVAITFYEFGGRKLVEGVVNAITRRIKKKITDGENEKD